MSFNPVRIFRLPRWVVSRACDAVGAKMGGVAALTQAGRDVQSRDIMATNHKNPSQISIPCAPSSLVAQERAEAVEPHPTPYTLPSLLKTQTGEGNTRQLWSYVLRGIFTPKRLSFSGQKFTLEPSPEHSPSFQARYPARCLSLQRRNVPILTALRRVGYFNSFAVELLKQPLRRFSQAFRLSLPGTPAEILDVYDVANGDVPFIPEPLLRLKHSSTGETQGGGNFRQKRGEFPQGEN
jgi:hypothetical protein